ncbi:hypothetical protein HPB51_028080 [Rhipicephalus microplus]|uniref:Uncharacterized protein n=1 Tax=Rhipicephalus microplus TaxID=6941 RepID=A0A9J6CXZ6_RHIMP|nr:hypothetical protein HPB51_028080 [Rhipicephalus microplus]
MSSYHWPRDFRSGVDQNAWFGPPSDAAWNIRHVVQRSDNTCGGGWICEHRWRQIYNLVELHNVAGFSSVTNCNIINASKSKNNRDSKGYTNKDDDEWNHLRKNTRGLWKAVYKRVNQTDDIFKISRSKQRKHRIQDIFLRDVE